MTYKTQEIIAKCLKQFDLRLFEEIGGNVQEKKHNWKKKIKNKKNTFRAFASRANYSDKYEFTRSIIIYEVQKENASK